MKRIALLGAAAALANAHFTIWTPSMYGFHKQSQNPIGPGIMNQADWWFRGPDALNDPPQNGAVTELIAGGEVTFEVNCNKEFTSFGSSGQAKACPDWGPYHLDAQGGKFPPDVVAQNAGGCALGIADVDDIGKTNWNNIVIFSVRHRCVVDEKITFPIPSLMPACSGSKCICGWFWQPQFGASNFYMTGFDCSVKQTIPGNRGYQSPQTPAQCDGKSNCVAGAKSPIYIWNNPENINWPQSDNRPGYRPEWSFFEGPQNDIFTFGGPSKPAPDANSRNKQIPYPYAPAARYRKIRRAHRLINSNASLANAAEPPLE